jgi:hypothetical protein
MTADEIRQLKPLTYRNVLSHFQGGGSVSLQATRAVGRPMFEYVALSWVWSYGDSNPRPLACHASEAFNSLSGRSPISHIIAGRDHTIDANRFRQMPIADTLSTVK